jgi:glycosyltransferase involved in cell wall biosynthesis
MTGAVLALGNGALWLLGFIFRRKIVARAIIWLSYRTLELCVRLGRWRTQRRLAKGRPRSLWGFTPLLTLPLKAKADELLGIHAESVVWTTYHISRRFTRNLRLLPAIVRRLNPELLGSLGRFVLAFALLRYDIFHYFNDRALLWPNRILALEPDELDILKRAGKRSYVFVYGADIRTRAATLALGPWNVCAECPEPGRFCICDDAKGRADVAEVMARATAMVAMADMTVYAPGAQRLDYWPIDTAALTAGPPPRTDGPLVIAHAPNHTHFKGTHYLQAAVAKLQAEGLPLTLSLLTGVPNTEVMRLFAEADVVADQFIAGAYGYTALEAMARAKPVLCYIRSADCVLAAGECPLLQTSPETIEQVLRWCLANREALSRIGAQGRAYVERHHAVPAVAGRFSALYDETGNFPPDLRARWEGFRQQEAERQAAVLPVTGWQHPFLVEDIAPSDQSFAGKAS